MRRRLLSNVKGIAALSGLLAVLRAERHPLGARLSANKTEALRELAGLRQSRPVSSLKEIFERTDRLQECMLAIGPDKLAQSYADKIYSHDYDLLIVQHTVVEDGESEAWKNRAVAHHGSMLNVHINALEKWLRGEKREARRYIRQTLPQIAAQAPPTSENEHFEVVAREPSLMLRRRVQHPVEDANE